MPYGTRRVVAVALGAIPGLKYGFKTDVADATSTILGHVAAIDASGNYIAGVAFGINSPKPPKAKKFFGSATKRFESSFVDKDAVNNARADGWIITPGKRQNARSTDFSKLVYVDFKVQDAVAAVGGTPAVAAITIKYCWRIPQYQYVKFLATDKDILGIKDVTSADVRELIIGLNNPKPRRASKTVIINGKEQTYSTFVASDKVDTLPSGGWA